MIDVLGSAVRTWLGALYEMPGVGIISGFNTWDSWNLLKMSLYYIMNHAFLESQMLSLHWPAQSSGQIFGLLHLTVEHAFKKQSSFLATP